MTISHNLITILHLKIVCGVLTVALTSDYYNQHARGSSSGCGVVVQKNQSINNNLHSNATITELHINQLIPTLAKMPIP
jgi:hypothetical protein